jgi:hypothetical protein
LIPRRHPKLGGLCLRPISAGALEAHTTGSCSTVHAKQASESRFIRIKITANKKCNTKLWDTILLMKLLVNVHFSSNTHVTVNIYYLKNEPDVLNRII